MKYIKYGCMFFLTYIKLLLLKILFRYKISNTAFTIIRSNSTIKTSGNGRIKFGKMVTVSNNAEISANGGVINFSGNNYVNRNTLIISHKSISIGERTTIGPNVLIYDHDHNINKCKNDCDDFVSEPVIIGSNVWIGAGCIILKGVTIGNNVVIAAGSVITSDIKDNRIIYQKRITNEKIRV